MLMLARFWFGETNLTAIDRKLSLSGLGWAGRQEAEPRASVGWGAVSEPQPARATQCLRCVLRLHAGLSLLFCEQGESGSSVLGESQDIEADS